ncbi:MAG: type IX secretion system motor protein PorM/GldM [Luteibaculaceae bacterium]
MAGGKETPRQKLIGMMYLVLMALLALNVSKDVLLAFVNVDTSLARTNANFANKKSDLYRAFDAAYADNPKKVEAFRNDAFLIREISQKTRNYVDSVKANVIAATMKVDISLAIAPNEFGLDTVVSMRNTIAGKSIVLDNYDIPTNILGVGDVANPRDGRFTAVEMQRRIRGYADEVIEILEKYNGSGFATPLIEAVNQTFAFERQMEGGREVSWMAANLYHAPLAAVAAIMTKMNTDILNTEYDAVAFLLRQVDAGTFKFTNLEAVAVVTSNAVVKGDTFRADVFLAAFDPTNNPIVEFGSQVTDTAIASYKVGGESLPIPVSVKNGKGRVRIPASAVGEKEWKGVIRFNAGGGEVINAPITLAYQVTEPNLVVSPTKVNVMYRKLGNPVEISVPGFTQDKIKPSMTNGTLIPDPKTGGFIARPGDGNISKISVVATLPDGSTKNMGEKEFRILDVPPPTVIFAGRTPFSSDMTINQGPLKAATVVKAELKDFLFDMEFEIVSFKLKTYVKGQPIERRSTSGALTPEMKALLSNVTSNQIVILESIQAKNLETGEVRQIAGLTLTVN